MGRHWTGTHGDGFSEYDQTDYQFVSIGRNDSHRVPEELSEIAEIVLSEVRSSCFQNVLTFLSEY